MHEEIIIAGFGGQGVILAGKLLCIAAMREGKFVSHIPSYGAEMRGGTANCAVVISDEEIASPVVQKPTIAIVLNTPSLLKFQPRIKPEGLLIYNSSLIEQIPDRTDLEIQAVRANHLAEEAGSGRSANMAALGLLLKLKPEIARLPSVIEALDEAVSERNKKFNPVNRKVLEAGFGSI